MKFKAVKVFSILAVLMLFGWALKGIMVSSQPENTAGNLRVIESVTRVRLGEIGFITIQGTPGVRYTVTSSFKTGEKTRSASQWRITDESGRATFLWSVNPDTVPGTYPVTISGDGRTINISHTVLP
jgi:hypothetical protein